MAARVLLALLSMLGLSAAIHLSVSNEKTFSMSPVMYSAFFETEINFGSEGGLYAELIANRDFEALGRGTIPSVDRLRSEEEMSEIRHKQYAPGLDPGEPPAIPTDFRPWAAVGSAKLAINSSAPVFATNPMTLSLTSTCMTPPCLAGVRNPGYWGINVRAGLSYNLTFFARVVRGPVALQPRLVSSAGEIIARASKPIALQGGWAQYSAVLTASESDPQGAFELVSIADTSISVLLDGVSLFPGDAVAGLFRRDLFEAMQALRPGFVRCPGGNYLEGTGPRTRWDWKSTIGPKEQRPGHYNSAWGYWVTDGMGLYEQLALAEALGSQAQLGVFTGYSMGQPYIPLDQSQVFAQDALDLLEFANGATWTPYGSVRASSGHPAPFGLSRLEVGNEERLMQPGDYPGHYKLITQAIWSHDPNITVVASGRWGPDITGNPCLTGQRCDAWDDHYYRRPDEMAAMGHTYDNYNRSWPDVFVGEFAAAVDNKQSLGAAVAEAMFMIGFEINGDKVVASSFAPLFRRVDAQQWAYDLINFDSSRLYGLPSHSMQVMLHAAVPTHQLKFNVDGAPKTVMLTAGLREDDNTVVIKAANYAAQSQTVDVALSGFSSVGTSGALTVLTSSQGPDVQNTLENPHAVVPATQTLAVGSSFTMTLPAWSVVTLVIPLTV